MKKITSLILVVGLLCTLLLVGCGGGGASSSDSGSSSDDSSGDTIKIGMLIPYAGVEAQWAKQMEYSTQIAVDEVNENGGLLGKKLEVFYEDTEGMPDVATEKANKLLQKNKVDVLMGCISDASKYAVFDIAEKEHVIYINPTYYTGALFGDYFFSSGAGPNKFIYPSIDWAMEQGKKKFYFVGSDYAWGYGCVASAKRYVEEKGGKVVGDEFTPMDTTDYSATLARIEKSGAEVMMPFVAGTDGATLVKQFAAYSLKEKVQICTIHFDETLIKGLDADTVAGITYANDYLQQLDTEENKAFTKKINEYAGEDLGQSTFGMNSYYNVIFWTKAVEAAGTVDADEVSKKLVNLKIDGINGSPVYFDDTHHMVSDVFLTQINDKKEHKLIKTFEQVKPVIEPEVEM